MYSRRRSHFQQKASAHILAPHLAEGKGLVTGYTFPFNTGSDGIIGHVALDTANPEEYRVIGRLVLATTTGSLQLWQHDQQQWAREEGLADTKLAEFVELPERKLAETLRLKADAEERGEDVERQKNWEWTIEENDEWEKKQARKAGRADFQFHSECIASRVRKQQAV